MDLLAFERKLDQTIMRKRVDIQEALKRPMKVLWGQEEGSKSCSQNGEVGLPRVGAQCSLCTTLFISTAKAEAASLYLQYF